MRQNIYKTLQYQALRISAVEDIISAGHHLEKLFKALPVIVYIELICMAPDIEKLGLVGL